MGITSIIGVGIIGTVLSALLRSYRPELGICASLATGLAIMAMCIPELQTAMEEIYALVEQAPVNTQYFRAIFKIIGIAYLTQFAAEAAKDAGEGAAAKKLEMAGKVSVLVIMLPIVRSLMQIIFSTLSAI